MLRGTSTCSDRCATDEDLAAWASPASRSTPQCGAVPAELACLSTSMERSTPGPLPYHMPNTPSRVAPGNRFSCWVPHTAVAARSSFRPGWKTTRSEEHTSELQSLMRISYAVFCLKKQKRTHKHPDYVLETHKAY